MLLNLNPRLHCSDIEFVLNKGKYSFLKYSKDGSIKIEVIVRKVDVLFIVDELYYKKSPDGTYLMFGTKVTYSLFSKPIVDYLDYNYYGDKSSKPIIHNYDNITINLSLSHGIVERKYQSLYLNNSRFENKTYDLLMSKLHVLEESMLSDLLV